MSEPVVLVHRCGEGDDKCSLCKWLEGDDDA